MTSTIKDHHPVPDSPELPDGIVSRLQPVHTDFSQRAVCLAKDAQWVDTALPGVQIRVMEFVPGTRARLAAQLRLVHGHTPLIMERYPDLEVLIQAGQLGSAHGDFPANEYFRLPPLNKDGAGELVVQRAATMRSEDPTVLYFAAGQMQHSDTERRQIDTTDENRWFAGPVEGTDVLPLHGHGCGNVMLVRWNTTTAFRTRIDPRGEELLVLDGAVYDTHGHYPQGSWIRNPIEAWQYWGARAGTVMYYKNGHFANSDCADDRQFNDRSDEPER